MSRYKVSFELPNQGLTATAIKQLIQTSFPDAEGINVEEIDGE